MEKKTMKKTAIVAIAMILAVLLLLPVLLPLVTDKAYASEATLLKQFTDPIITNRDQYFDSDVVQSLPSTIKDDDDISIILSFDTPALVDEYNKTDKAISFTEYAFSKEASEIVEGIKAEKNDILKVFDEKGINYELGADYSAVLTGFEIIIKARDFEAVCDNVDNTVTPIVCEVYQKAETQLVENNVNVYETGIFNSTGYKYDGTGMVVAVLDTGLDYTHSAFSLANFTADRNKLGLTQKVVSSLINTTKASTMVEGLTGDDVYINEKVPFAFDYADRDSDVYSLHNNHGTHVSGVIVGKDDTITGVAPNAQLVSMKIFSDTKDSAIASWILSALEDCVILGVDVINMSLGTACGFSRETDEEKLSGVYDKIRAQGISLIVAASNSFTSSYGSEKNGNLGLTTNPDTATVGSPSTYEGALSIASINGIKTPYILHNGKIVYFVEASNSAAEEKYFVDDLLDDGVNEIEVEYVLVPGVGREADYYGVDVTGKIALIKRGDTTFEEKAQVAQKMGAIGVIVYNNTSGDIKMNVGTVKIAVCSVSQEDGEALAAEGKGTIKISRDQTSGPFMSDFSSWGPSPSLGIKPELTAHGGNILSSVTGGGYDRLSGTSMACPNTAGVVILLRQYVMDAFPQIADQPVKVNSLVNQLLMSTADIVYNKNGLPYAVRKQGAGLASLIDASETLAYIQTYDRETGKAMDKTKIELGDDPQKTGVYTLTFDIVNFGSTNLSYDLSAYVMTEGVSEIKTHKGEYTVNEEGYLLEGATVTFTVENGTQNGNNVTVNAGQNAKVTVTITLSDEDKKYIDDSFANGMYVEGFVMLDATGDTKQDLNVPYLAFYGDWTQAPILDLDYFETSADELDDSIATLDKTLPDAYATRPIGGLYSDYIAYLGSYYFEQNPNDRIISASRDYIAISNVKVADNATEDDQGLATIHSLRFIWTGMLRNASKVVVTITDDATGEVIYEVVDESVRKSYGDGGSYIYPANVEVEFDATEHNLKNNSKYTVKMVAHMDYGDGGIDTNLKNVFEFPFTTDFEAPAVTDCTFRTEYDSDKKITRLFAELAVYDNHYAMCMQPGYITQTTNEEGALQYELVPFSTYMTPIYSVRNGTTYVEYELTDYIYDLKQSAHSKNSFIVSVYDYALNHATFEIGLPDEYVDFYFDLGTDSEGNPNTELTLNPYEIYNLKPLVRPDTEWSDLLTYESSNKKVAIIVNNKVVPLAKGVSTIYAKDDNGNIRSFKLNVLGPGDTGYIAYDKPSVDRFEVLGFDTLKAFEVMDNEDRDIGETGGFKLFANNDSLSIEMYPSESVKLRYILEAYFPSDVTLVFETGNEKIVKVDQTGVITGVSEGMTSVSVRVYMDGKSTYYSKNISITIKDPFVTAAPSLTHYFGNGGVVEIPADLLLTKIGAFAFSNSTYVLKTDAEYAEDDTSRTKQSPIGENTITKIIIPEGVKTIDAYAFAKLTALKEVVLPSTIENIEYGAFAYCTSLEKVTGIENVQLINQGAFTGCNLKGTLTLNKACAVGDDAFSYNTRLESVVVSDKLQSIGAYAFAGCTSLNNVTINAEKVKYGPYVFSFCTSLVNASMNANVIPEGAYFGCSNLENVNIGKDVGYIGELAFADTKMSKFTVTGNSAYKVSDDGRFLLSTDGTTILTVLPTLAGKVEITDSKITTIGTGAFAGNSKITEIVAPSVTKVLGYAFYDCSMLDTISLGKLTEIGEYAYYNTAITQLPSLDNIKEISRYAFAYSKLTSVEIPDNMIIGEGAFTECSSLASIKIGNSVTIGHSAFKSSWDWSIKTPEYILDPSYTNKVYYLYVPSSIKTLEIGNDVIIGDEAFYGATELSSVTLGTGAVIGRMSFYNCPKLKDIDLSNVKVIGDYAFSGDEYPTFSSATGLGAGVDDEGNYVTRAYASALRVIYLDKLESLGAYAFALCDDLISVQLGGGVKVIPERAFKRATSLASITLDTVETIGLEAFAETSLLAVDLSNVVEIGKHAFAYCEKLIIASLNKNGVVIKEGAFTSCAKLSTVYNLDKVTEIGAYAFALTSITDLDLSGATSIGDLAFYKETFTPVTVKVGSGLVSIGDNPFAMCIVEPFFITETEEFNGTSYETNNYTFNISDTVMVIDGSLYAKVPSGLELICYAGIDNSYVSVADSTVRITAYAFAGSNVVRVKLPYTVNAIGHKAFYKCNDLITVIFNSHTAPVLEEELDLDRFVVFNVPASGEYEYYDDNGNTQVTSGLGIIPYFMFNPMTYTSDYTVANYYSMYYGASFVNYIGEGNPNLIMIRPSNGVEYDSFIMSQYFTTTIDGSVAAEKTTITAIEAINKLPERVQLTDEALVVAAREAYNKVAKQEQLALITNYNKLLTAEQRIKSFKEEINTPSDDAVVTPPSDQGNTENGSGALLVVLVVVEAVVILGIGVTSVVIWKKKRK